MSYRNHMIFDVVLKPKAIKDLRGILSIEEALEDADDLQCLKEARAEEWNAPTASLNSVRKTLTI